MIAIIDYGVGNLRSVHNAVSFISPKKKSFVTNDPDKVMKADKIIFPGQGAMPGCVRELDKRGLKEVLIESGSYISHFPPQVNAAITLIMKTL